MSRAYCNIILFILFSLASIPISAQWEQPENFPRASESWSQALSISALDSSNVVISVESAAGSRGGLYRTTDGGANWKLIYEASSNYFVHVSMPAKNNIWATTMNGEIYCTQNGGTSWNRQYFDSSKTGCMMNYIRMFDVKNGVAMGDNTDGSKPAVFLTTTDGGNVWTSVNTEAFGGFSGDMWRRVDFPGNNTGYFFESGKNPQYIYKTSNSGRNWTKLEPPASLMVLKFFDENLGLYIGKNNSNTYIYRTKNGGLSWESILFNSSGWGNDIEFVPGEPAKVWFTDGKKLFYSPDTCATFNEYSLNIQTTTMLRDIAFSDKFHGWILGDNGIILKTRHPLYVTDVKKDQLQAENFTLLQNYPNPFNPETRISFTIPESRFVQLKVYDLLGKEVSAIVNEQMNAGSHTVQFNASDLRSGMYIYVLRAGEYSSFRKMVLLR